MELNFELEEKLMTKKAEEVIKNVNKNMDKVLKEINYISEILRKKALAQLQRNFGLILVPKEEVIVTDNEIEADSDEKYLYEWDPEFFKKSYRIPKFREKLENMISVAHDELNELLEKKELDKLNNRKEKLKKKIQNALKKANEWYDKLMEDFSKTIGKIYPYFEYLDTDERKVIEYFEERSSEYYKILNNLNRRAELDLER